MGEHMNAPVIECRGLHKHFGRAEGRVPVLCGIDFAVAAGEQVAVVGTSGAGKSTFLQLLGGLDLPSSGVLRVAGHDLAPLSEAARGRLRNRCLGFIYQFHHLLPEFSALENVSMPLWVGRRPPAESRRRASELLCRVGLEHRLHHKPGELSGGERQRTAVARALVTRPLCVLADEPTGNLDRHTAARVYELMRELNRDAGVSLVIVTHDQNLAGRADRIVRLEDGALRLEAAAPGLEAVSSGPEVGAGAGAGE